MLKFRSEHCLERPIAIQRPPQMGKVSKNPAYFYDLNAKITYTPTRNDVISFSFFNGSDYNNNTPQFGFDGGGPGGFGGDFGNMNISMDNSDYQRYGNLGTSLRWSRKLNERWSMNLLGSFSYFYATRDYQIPSASGTVESYYAVSDKNTYRLPDYHRLDLSASYRFDLFGSSGRQNAISFSLFNAYNRRNVSAKQFQIVDGVILESNINYLSITPNLSLTLKF